MSSLRLPLASPIGGIRTFTSPMLFVELIHYR